MTHVVAAGSWNAREKSSFAGGGRINRTRSNGNFPGGKVEPGESPASGTGARTCARNWVSKPPSAAELMRYEFAYPGKPPILLIFLMVTAWQGEVRKPHFRNACLGIGGSACEL